MQSENDREVADRTQADTEFLAREMAGVRLMLADVVTGEELREQLAELERRRVDALPPTRLADEPARPVHRADAESPRPSPSAGSPVNACRRTP